MFQIIALSLTTMRWERLGVIKAENEYQATMSSKETFGKSHTDIFVLEVAA